MMVSYFTKYSDYLTNLKIPAKDMAVAREFLEPFKWDFIIETKHKLGNSIGLLEESLNSGCFWKELKKSHAELK